MKRYAWTDCFFLVSGLLLALGGVVPAQSGVDGGEPRFAGPAEASALTVDYRPPLALFQVTDPRAASVRLVVQDGEGHTVFDSGEQPGPEAEWDTRQLLARRDAALDFELRAWDGDGRLIVRQAGWLERGAEEPELVQALSGYDVEGNYTIGGYLGVGTGAPQRAIHIQGSNAVFRMDRSKDTAAFMIVRNDDEGNILKTFVVGVNAVGANNGSFVINDLGASVGGAGVNRLTIDNAGTATFGGQVKATGFVNQSSRRFKTNIRPIGDALGLVERLQGVTFDWRATGEHALGLIAEDVAEVVPELVSLDGEGRPSGVDYGRVTALLVESIKQQQQEIESIQWDCDRLEARVENALKK